MRYNIKAVSDGSQAKYLLIGGSRSESPQRKQEEWNFLRASVNIYSGDLSSISTYFVLLKLCTLLASYAVEHARFFQIPNYRTQNSDKGPGGEYLQ